MDREVEVLHTAESLHKERDWKKLRSIILANANECVTDDVKLQLLHLWEESLYEEAIDLKPEGDKKLSSSVKYKLRKKHPCPIEMDEEKTKAKNARLPKPVHELLGGWLRTHRENPYPNKVEKEEMASQLGISPQQVNRWFIQRRKMLRIRGELHGVDPQQQPRSNKGREESMDDSRAISPHLIYEGGAAHYNDEVYRQDADESAGKLQEFTRTGFEENKAPCRCSPPPSASSLLEKILTTTKQRTLCSGGCVEVVPGEQISYPLTPPQSVSGEPPSMSSPPGTPFNPMEQTEPIDLSQKQDPKCTKVILEPVSPTWKFSLRSEALTPDSCHNVYLKQRPESPCSVLELNEDVQIAVTALLTLSGGGARRC